MNTSEPGKESDMKKIFVLAAAVFAGALILFSGAEAGGRNDIRAAYLSVDKLGDRVARESLKNLVRTTELNAIVMDCKESGLTPDSALVKTALAEFKAVGAYTICRFVVAQDNKFVKEHPGAAVRIGKGGDLWYSRRTPIFKRDSKGKLVLDGRGEAIVEKYTGHLRWADMAAPETYRYNRDLALEVVKLGFDEINFDYIRFPTDGPKDKYFPAWDNTSPKPTKREVVEGFCGRLANELRAEKLPNGGTIVISLDPFGYAFFGEESGIGQSVLGLAKCADVLMPMTYPTHYRKGEFGFEDPSLHPGEVVRLTLEKGVKILRAAGMQTIVRPWIQDFAIGNIYGAYDAKQAHRYEWRVNSKTGKKYFIVPYHEKEVRAQIEAARSLGLMGYALWNASSDYTAEALVPKKGHQ